MVSVAMVDSKKRVTLRRTMFPLIHTCALLSAAIFSVVSPWTSVRGTTRRRYVHALVGQAVSLAGAIQCASGLEPTKVVDAAINSNDVHSQCFRGIPTRTLCFSLGCFIVRVCLDRQVLPTFGAVQVRQDSLAADHRFSCLRPCGRRLRSRAIQGHARNRFTCSWWAQFGARSVVRSGFYTDHFQFVLRKQYEPVGQSTLLNHVCVSSTANRLNPLPRKSDGSCCVGRDADGKATLALLPVRDDRAICRVVLDVQTRKSRIEVRLDCNVMESRAAGICIDASSATINPSHHRTKGVVIVGIHRRISGVAVPALPPSSRTLFHHVAPGGIG